MRHVRDFLDEVFPDVYLAILVAAIVTSALAAVLFVPIIPEPKEVPHAQTTRHNPDRHP